MDKTYTVTNEEYINASKNLDNKKVIAGLVKKFVNCLDPDEVVSITQGSLLKALQDWNGNISSFDPTKQQTKFTTYLSLIVYRDLKYHARKSLAYRNKIRFPKDFSFHNVEGRPDTVFPSVKLDSLSDMEKDIVNLKFNECKTLETIALKYDVSKESIRKILQRIFKKLKRNNEGVYN